MAGVLEEWMVQHKKMYEAHAAEQERLLRMLLGCHEETLRELGVACDAGGEGEELRKWQEEVEAACGASASVADSAGLLRHTSQGGSSTWRQRWDAPSEAIPRKPPWTRGWTSQHDGTGLKPAQPVAPDRGGPTAPTSDLPKKDGVASGDDEEGMEDLEELMQAWTQSSGLHTVGKWVKDYRRHPAGWGALLAIHGVPEVTFRLRSKVDNYAIYSALFLSMSMTLLTDAPDVASEECLGSWECNLRKRIYAVGLATGTAAHMLSIVLGMAFNNALNEAARDSDVFRMFARGRGFLATVMCQRAFTVGTIADFIAVATAISHYTSWAEAFGGLLVLALLVLYIYRRTASLLFVNASICKYWREELGGRPDKDDPYDLQVAMARFSHREQLNERYFRRAVGYAEGGMSTAELSRQVRRQTRSATSGSIARSPPELRSTLSSTAVAGIF